MKKKQTAPFLRTREGQKLLLKMKLTFIIVLTCLMQVSATVYSQATKFSFSVQNKQVVDVLREIEEKSDFRFFYQREQIDVTRKVDMNVSNKTVETVLDELFANVGVSYKVMKDNLIVLTPTFGNNASAGFGQQQRIVSGKVTDPSGSPLPGVSVVVKGTTTGTITDSDGNYSFSNLKSESILQFSFIGMKQQEIMVGSKTRIDISLVEDAIGIEEVVAVGYGTRAKSDLTGAVSTVNSNYLKEQPVADVTKALQGSVSGIRVTRPSVPGADAVIRIRGMGTINNNNPLWVVDGVVGADVPAPNQIESIEVLKDASSTAIYGARGASGVILVTTKSGRANQPAKVEFSVRNGFNAPSAKFNFMTDPQHIGELLWLEMKNDGLPTTHAHFGSGSVPVLNEYLFPNGGTTGSPGVNPDLYNQKTYPITKSNPAGTDWLDAIYQNGYNQDYNISVSGGSEKTTYAFTGSYMDESGIFKYTGYQRLGLRSNIDSKVTPWLSLGQRLGVTFSETRGYRGNNSHENLLNKIYLASPIVPVSDIAGNWAGSIVGGNLGDWYNPLGFLKRGENDKNKIYNITGNFYAEITPIKGLSLKTLYGYDVRLINGFDPSFAEWENTNGARGTTLSESSSNNSLWNWTNTLNYNATFNNIHKIDVLFGVETTKNVYRDLSASRQNYFSDDINFLVLDAGASNQLNNGTGYVWSLFSNFGRVHYSYNQRYLFDLTVRRDGSSRFGEKNRYGVFPAVAVGWIISQENFMAETSNWLNQLKLRASWGKSGNDRIGNYNSYSTYASVAGNSYYAIGGSDNVITQGYQSTAIGNPNAKWESTASTNIAVDATIFDSFDFSIDLWQKKTEDMLFTVAIPLVAGSAQAPSVNIGAMKNTGIDINLGYHGETLSKELKYDISANFSHYKNEVLKLSGNENEFLQGFETRQQIYTRTEMGHAFPEFFGYVVDGIFQTQAEADAHAVNGTYNQPGNLIIRDIAGAFDSNGNPIPDNKITPADRTYIGSPHPDFTAGMRIGLEYKGFDFSCTWYTSVGNDIANYTSRFLKYGLFKGPKSNERLFNSWGSPYLDDNNKATLPKVSSVTSFEQNASSAYIEDGSFLRLQNLQVGYNLPKSILSFMRLQNVRLYAMGSNLLTFTKYSGLDPEIIPELNNEINMGVDVGTWPISKQFVFGVDITL